MNAGKTTIMVGGTGLDLLQSSGKFSCVICRTGVGSVVFNVTDAFTGCTRSTEGSSTFKRAQTTGALDFKELPDPKSKTTGGGYGYI